MKQTERMKLEKKIPQSSLRIEEVGDEDCEEDSGNEALYITILRPIGQ